MRRNTHKPTLRSLADGLGLSVATVSRALDDDPRIAEATRARVKKAADEANYRRHTAARMLKTGRTLTVSLVVDFPPNVPNTFLSFAHDMVRGLHRALANARYHLNIVPNLGEDPLDVYRRLVEDRRADGVAFSLIARQDPRIAYLTEVGFPFVTHGQADLSPPGSFVDFDGASFAKAAVEHLVARGAKRILLLHPPETYTFGSHLKAGARAGADATGCELTFHADLNWDPGFAELSRTLSELIPEGTCTGIIAHTGQAAREVIETCRLAGRELGRDILVATKSGPNQLDGLPPGVGYTVEDFEAEGCVMGRFLLAQFKDETAPPATRIFGPPEFRISREET